ncbi:organic hydroperoxide resistance protein [Obelidium mucronatum]|nr:organic hydroperoxide resistance protein [Obelidium mucronatum]
MFSSSRFVVQSIQRAQRRSLSTIKPFYTAESTATGGRDGSVTGTEGFKSKMVLPTALKGPGASATAQNPEVLFASGYAACFLGAVHAAAGELKIAVPKDSSVTVKTHLGHIQTNGAGFGLAVDITGNFPGLDKAKARALVDKAHNDICPYSKATRGNIVVNVNV